MRTIKFRGKNIETCEWVYGFYTQGGYIREDGTLKVRHIIHSDFLYDVEENTIGQYTGLQDKNGVEIYEGDIVRVSCVPVKYIGTNAISYIVDCICVFFQGSFIYKRISPFDKQKLSRNWTYKPMNRLDIKEVEVIGNIHDNPELLKGE